MVGSPGWNPESDEGHEVEIEEILIKYKLWLIILCHIVSLIVNNV